MSEEAIQEKQEADGMLTKKGAIIAIVKSKYGGNGQETESVFEESNRDLWSILSGKPEGEAGEKMKGC